MDRCENFNSQRMKHLVVAQTIFTALTLGLGIVQAAGPVIDIFPIFCSIFQIAPIVCGVLASERKNKCTIVTSMVLNIQSAISSFGQICHSVAFAAISWIDYYYTIFGAFCIPFMLFGLALFVINIWAAALSYVCCHSQPRVVHYVAAGGHVVVMQTNAYRPGRGSNMPGYPQAPGTNMQEYPSPPYPQSAGIPPRYGQECCTK